MNHSISPAGSAAASSRPSLPQQAIDGKLQSSAANASSRAQERASPNSAVAMVAQQQADIQVAEQPLSLLARTLTEGLNASLQASLGEQATVLAFDEEPGAELFVSQFKASLSALFERYSLARPEPPPATTFGEFMDLVRAGLEQGFAEAREVLGGLSVSAEESTADLDQVEGLINGVLAAFEADFAAATASDDSAASDGGPAPDAA